MSFNVIRQKGIAWVDRAADEVFRKALMDGVPPQLHKKMHEALSATPNEQSRAHSERYFGAELPAIKNQIAPLVIELNRVVPGLFDWLDVTGYGSEYRMIKAFHAWSEMILSSAKAAQQADG